MGGRGIGVSYFEVSVKFKEDTSAPLTLRDGLIDRPALPGGRRGGLQRLFHRSLFAGWRTAEPGVCASVAVCVRVRACVSEGDIDWSYFCFAT